MSIKVTTPDHGVQEFDADDWDIREADRPHGGSLWVGRDDVGVAQFAPGQWLFVQEIKGEARIWQSLDDVPAGICVRDKDDDFWSESDIRLEVTDAPRTDEGKMRADRWGPFTESKGL